MADEQTFTCELCGGTFLKEWTDEEAREETRQVFGVNVEDDPESFATLCDDCWQKCVRYLPRDKQP